MTTTTTLSFEHDVQHGLSSIVRDLAAVVRSHLALHRERARLHAELSHCSDRELADMNISRADIDYMVRSWQPG